MKLSDKYAETGRLLQKFKSKGACEHTWETAERCLRELKPLIEEQDYYNLRLALSHVKQGEGNDAFYYECDQVIKKYK